MPMIKANPEAICHLCRVIACVLILASSLSQHQLKFLRKILNRCSLAAIDFQVQPRPLPLGNLLYPVPVADGDLEAKPGG